MHQKEEITVYKLDESGHEVWQYPARVLNRSAGVITLEAFFDRPAVDLGPVALERGDRFVETFYEDRWYNVFAVYDAETSALKGWYCNICRPAAISRKAVRCEDLALDVWVSAEGASTVMDEVEFEALSLSRQDRLHARKALQRILTLASEGRLPK